MCNIHTCGGGLLLNCGKHANRYACFGGSRLVCVRNPSPCHALEPMEQICITMWVVSRNLDQDVPQGCEVFRCAFVRSH